LLIVEIIEGRMLPSRFAGAWQKLVSIFAGGAAADFCRRAAGFWR